MMIEPKDIELKGKVYTISKFTAIEGREIVTQYLSSATPKLGDYKRNEELMLKLMKYVGVSNGNGGHIMLITPELVNNHLRDWETLIHMEKEVMTYNCSFFQDGRASTFFAGFVQKVPAWITKMLMALSEQSLPTEKPSSTN